MMNSTIECADGRKSLMEYSEIKNVSDASFADGRIDEKKICKLNSAFGADCKINRFK
jgi:hypothetical protein